MKLEFKNFQGKMDGRDLLKKAGTLAVKKESFVLGFLALVLIGYCGFLWYEYNYNYKWDEAQKQEYVRTKRSGIDFEKGKFEEVLSDIDARKDRYEEEVAKEKDIFRLNVKN